MGVTTFISIQRLGHALGFMRVEDDEFVFGADATGVLAVTGVKKALFSVCYHRVLIHSTLLRHESGELEANSHSLAARQPLILSYRDYRLLVVRVSSLARFYGSFADLALSHLTQPHAGLWLRLRYGGRRQSFPLPYGRMIFVGSDPSCQVILRLAGVMPRHLGLLNRLEGLEVVPQQGILGMEEEVFKVPVHIHQFPATLLLKPLDLPMTILGHAA